MFLGGATAIVAGVWQFSAPAAWIVGGGMLVTLSMMLCAPAAGDQSGPTSEHTPPADNAAPQRRAPLRREPRRTETQRSMPALASPDLETTQQGPKR